MATLAHNNAKFVINGVDVSGFATEVTFSPGGSSNETTAGFGVEWVQRQPGLKDFSLTATLAYDTVGLPTYVQNLQPQEVYTVEFYPENETTGKPALVSDMILESAGPIRVGVDKAMTTIPLTFNNADTPAEFPTLGDVV